MVIAETFLLSTFVFAHSHAFTTVPSSKLGYTTISPGGTYAPVTVTSQYRPIPTYIPSVSSYETYLYVSTVITDADRANITVTNIDQPVTIHHHKYTITHTRAIDYSASTGIPHPASTGRFPYAQNASTTSQPHTNPSRRRALRRETLPHIHILASKPQIRCPEAKRSGPFRPLSFTKHCERSHHQFPETSSTKCVSEI